MRILFCILLFFSISEVFSQDNDYPRVGLTITALQNQVFSKDLDEDDGSMLFGPKHQSFRIGIVGELNRNIVTNVGIWKLHDDPSYLETSTERFYPYKLQAWYLSLDMSFRLMIGRAKLVPYIFGGGRYSLLLNKQLKINTPYSTHSNLHSFGGLFVGAGVQLKPFFVHFEFYPWPTSLGFTHHIGNRGSPRINSLGITSGISYDFFRKK